MRRLQNINNLSRKRVHKLRRSIRIPLEKLRAEIIKNHGPERRQVCASEKVIERLEKEVKECSKPQDRLACEKSKEPIYGELSAWKESAREMKEKEETCQIELRECVPMLN